MCNQYNINLVRMCFRILIYIYSYESIIADSWSIYDEFLFTHLLMLYLLNHLFGVLSNHPNKYFDILQVENSKVF